LLIEGILSRLEQMLQLTIDDDARAELIKVGLLQDDPTVKKINVTIHTGGEAWPDVLNTNDSGPDAYAPTYTIGGSYGSQFWRRRFRVEFNIFFAGTSRDDARKKSLLLLSRALHGLVTWDVSGEIATDSFGEHPYIIQVAQSWIEEGGGEGDYNWRGEMRLEFITELEPVDL
jgi:hypothetical protein